MKRILAIIFGCTILINCGSSEEAVAISTETEVPLSTIRITTVSGSRDQVLRSMKAFADQQAFAMRVGYPGPTDDYVTVQMWREDLKLIAVNPFNPDEFEISFYKNTHYVESGIALDHLSDELKVHLSEVHGTRIEDEMKK